MKNVLRQTRLANEVRENGILKMIKIIDKETSCYLMLRGNYMEQFSSQGNSKAEEENYTSPLSINIPSAISPGFPLFCLSSQAISLSVRNRPVFVPLKRSKIYTLHMRKP